MNSKKSIVFALLLVFCLSSVNETQFYIESFEEFKEQFQKEYPSSYEEKLRFKIFMENYQIIQQMNLQNHMEGVEFGINQYSDLTENEFNSKVLMPSKEADNIDQYKYREIPQNYLHDVKNIPSNWDWREHGAVTKVYNQGTVGTCWAFSSVQNVEGQWKLAGNKLTELSTEQLVECDTLTNPPNAACGIFGGWPYLGLQYIQEVGGIASNKEYRYCVGIPKKQDPCKPCTPEGMDVKLCGKSLRPPSCDNKKWHCRDKSVDFVAHIDGWEALSSDEEILKKQLYEIGPVSVLMNAQWLSWYKKGIWNPKRCSPKSLNHAVLLVGYGTDSKTNQDFWIVKNSWGEKWGEDGYFRIIRGEGKCGINKQPVSAKIDRKQQFNIEEIQI